MVLFGSIIVVSFYFLLPIRIYGNDVLNRIESNRNIFFLNLNALARVGLIVMRFITASARDEG